MFKIITIHCIEGNKQLTFKEKSLKKASERRVFMSSIESVSSTSSAVSALKNSNGSKKAKELSSSTKSKLESLGIDSSNVTSEAQAQVLIAQKESEKAQETQKTDSSGTNSTSSTEEEARTEAKSLATTLGLTVSSDDTTEDIISDIQTKITEMMSNPEYRTIALAYQQQVDSIANKISVTTDMYSALNQVAANNKYSLNLS